MNAAAGSEVPRPYPAIMPDTAFFWTAGKEGRLRILRCGACGHHQHPPTPRCPACLEDALAAVDLSGRATVAAKTINRHQWHPALPPPYVVAIVDLDDAPGVRLTTRIVNCPVDAVQAGMAVRVLFEEVGPTWLPLFEPID